MPSNGMALAGVDMALPPPPPPGDINCWGQDGNSGCVVPQGVPNSTTTAPQDSSRGSRDGHILDGEDGEQCWPAT